MRKIKIAPSVLAADFAHLSRDLRAAETADCLHVDIMDGTFVPNLSIGFPALEAIRRTTELFLDVHLMLVQPVRYVERFCDAGADLVSVHVEADIPANISDAIARIHGKGKKAGIVVKPNTRAEAVLPYLEQVELILVMTVEPGFGGQSLMEDMMPKVSTIRTWIEQRNPVCDLEVDGGVTVRTCGTCVRAGANVLVAGSSIFGAGDIPGSIAQLRECAARA